MSYLTIANYCVVAGLWLVILVLYARHRHLARVEDPLVATLLSILALDALKSFVENVFFAIIWAHNYGIAFPRLGATLARPEYLIAPKLLNTFVAIAVVAVVIRRWIPAELRTRRERERERADLVHALSASLAETQVKEQRWQLALDATRDGIFDLDVVTDHLWLSPRFSETLGYPGETREGTRDTLVELAHEDDRARFAGFLDRVIAETAAPREIELRQRTLDRRSRIVTVRVASVRDANGRAIRLVGAQSDVTERRANEAALAVRQRIESLGLLAGGVAHDFNNLLAVMKVNVETLHLLPPTADVLNDLDQAITRATDLTSQLLAYSGRGRLSVKTIDMSALAGDLVRLLGAATPANVTVHVRRSEEPAVVLGDSAQLQQVVMNLLTNAIDAIGDRSGTITVSTGLEDLAREEKLAIGGETIEPGRYVTLTVEDTGCGMSDEVLERIFDPFFTTKPHGRGLGMAAILGTLRAHKGGLRIHTVEGEGSRFVVLLPMASPAGG